VRANAESLFGEEQRRKAIVPPSLEATRHVRDAYYGVINDAIDNDPRSLQAEIGPSEIGDPCEYCLGAKLAGLRERKDGEGWLTYVGKWVHHGLDQTFRAQPGDLWISEGRLYVGYIDGRRIDGTADLGYTDDPFTVIDHKVVGKRTMDLVKFEEMKVVYRYQSQIYGRGYELAGCKPEHAAVSFLPREDRKVSRGYWWSEPYSRDMADEGMARAENLAIDIRLFGWAHVRDRLEHLEGCYNCKRWIQPEEE
jgi:hypothetical protein